MESRALSRPIALALKVALVLHIYSMLALNFTERPWLGLMIIPALIPMRLVYAGATAIGITLEYLVALLLIDGNPSRNAVAVGIACATVPVVMSIAALSRRLVAQSGRETRDGVWTRLMFTFLRGACPLLALASFVLLSSRDFDVYVLVPIGMANLLAAITMPRGKPGPTVVSHRLADLALLGGSLVFAIIIVEAGARLFIPVSLPQTGIFKPHSVAIVDLRPSVTRTLSYRASPSLVGSVPVTISPQSLREKYYGPKQPGEFRILLIGDSFTFGLTVPFPNTIGQQLEAMFARDALPRKITVINLGVPGTGPWQHQIYLKERGFSLEPDLVIQQLYLGNDLHDTFAQSGRQLRAFDLAREEQIQHQRLQAELRYRREQWLADHSRAYSVCRQWIGLRTITNFLARDCRFYQPLYIRPLPEPSGDPPAWEVNRVDWYPEIQEAMGNIVSTVNVTRAECQARGVGFAQYTVPIAEEVAPRLYERSRRLMGLPRDAQYKMGKGLRFLDARWRELGMPVIPVFNCLRAHPAPETLYRTADGHTSEAGNSVIAQCIRDYLVHVYFPAHPIGSQISPPSAKP